MYPYLIYKHFPKGEYFMIQHRATENELIELELKKYKSQFSMSECTNTLKQTYGNIYWANRWYILSSIVTWIMEELKQYGIPGVYVRILSIGVVFPK